MNTIWKYELHPDWNVINMPEGAEILTAQLQGKTPTIWVKVDPKAPLKERSVFIIGTGHEWENMDNLRYISTFQMNEIGMNLVWHVFESK